MIARWQPVILLIGVLVFALGIRLAVAGVDGVRSPAAGLVFAVVLAAGAWRWCPRPQLSLRQLGIGGIGALIVCLPAIVQRTLGEGIVLDPSVFPRWAVVVTAVAVAEEVLLRGALYERVQAAAGPRTAVIVSAVCFAFMHVPLYGWHVLVLDLVVGVVLSEVRRTSGSWTAPAISHTVADLAGWWLR